VRVFIKGEKMSSQDEEKRRSRYWFSKAFDEMEERFDELFQPFMEALGLDGPSWDVEKQCLVPLSEAKDAGDDVIVTVDLPYVSKDNIKLHATENTIEVEAKTDKGICFDRWGTVQKCLEFNCFRKKIKLPSEIKPKEAKASFKSGILEVRIPKRIDRTEIKID
jgi:HSP20 family protein